MNTNPSLLHDSRFSLNKLLVIRYPFYLVDDIVVCPCGVLIPSKVSVLAYFSFALPKNCNWDRLSKSLLTRNLKITIKERAMTRNSVVKKTSLPKKQ